MGPRHAPTQPAVETRKTYATSVRAARRHERAHGRTTLIDEITAFHIRSSLVGVLEQAGVIGRATSGWPDANARPSRCRLCVAGPEPGGNDDLGGRAAGGVRQGVISELTARPNVPGAAKLTARRRPGVTFGNPRRWSSWRLPPMSMEQDSASTQESLEPARSPPLVVWRCWRSSCSRTRRKSPSSSWPGASRGPLAARSRGGVAGALVWLGLGVLRRHGRRKERREDRRA